MSSTLQTLFTMIETLQSINALSTDYVSSIRKMIKHLDTLATQLVSEEITLSAQEIIDLQSEVTHLLSIANSSDIFEVHQNVTASFEIQTFQLGATEQDVILDFDTHSSIPPERGLLKQKLWKVRFTDGTTGHAIVTDTSDADVSALLTGQLATALSMSPAGSLEDLNTTVLLSDLESVINRDLTSIFNNLEKPGLVARQLRDIDIDGEPLLAELSTEDKTNLKNTISTLNNASTQEEMDNAQNALNTIASGLGLYSTTLGPVGNPEYSDLKRFRLQKADNSVVTVTMSMPVVAWGEDISGLPLRNPSGPKDKSNRKDDGTSYIVDLGGIDPAIRNGTPNPLPPTRFYNFGPAGATETEGALERYKGGKTLGINTTSESATIQILLKEADGVVSLEVPPMTALWKIDRATFDLSNKHAYYTVFSASRPPPAGFMGGVFAPKQNRLGRGRGEIASGVTLANGVSQTGQTFNLQNENGPILDTSNNEIPSNLKGVTCAFDGHGMHPVDILKFLQDNSFVKGEHYLTIPANATLETIEDVLIPSGQFIPQITRAVATLMQFGNGKFAPDGGPNRFQPGLIPFMPGTGAYTPEWHINFIYYNIGSVECEGNTYTIENPALDREPASWIRPNHNPSFGPPGPNPSNSEESGFSPAFPNTFDPVQLRCDIKNADAPEYIKKLSGSKHGEISLAMLPQLERDNKIFLTEAPGGALRGWVKFLVVNCPLPVVVNVNIEEITQNTSTHIPENPEDTNLTCTTCSCDRDATLVTINGILEPVWADDTHSIGNRRVNFKVGDRVTIKANTSTFHGVSVRFDDMTSNTTFDPSKPLAEIQSEVLAEIKDKIVIHNEQDLEVNFIAVENEIVEFHQGVPITFASKGVLNPLVTPDGVVIADFTIKSEAAGLSGSITCTIHGIGMAFKFDVCA